LRGFRNDSEKQSTYSELQLHKNFWERFLKVAGAGLQPPGRSSAESGTARMEKIFLFLPKDSKKT
jgi:hypothetical protein